MFIMIINMVSYIPSTKFYWCFVLWGLLLDLLCFLQLIFSSLLLIIIFDVFSPFIET